MPFFIGTHHILNAQDLFEPRGYHTGQIRHFTLLSLQKVFLNSSDVEIFVIQNLYVLWLRYLFVYRGYASLWQGSLEDDVGATGGSRDDLNISDLPSLFTSESQVLTSR